MTSYIKFLNIFIVLVELSVYICVSLNLLFVLVRGKTRSINQGTNGNAGFVIEILHNSKGSIKAII